jgi:hypothetical protein
VEEAAAIVNLAGENLAGAHFFPVRWTAERKKTLLKSRLNSGRAVVEAVEAASRKPQVVIQASAIGFYGPCGDEIITEESPAGDDFLARLCQRWEASTASVEAMGVRHVVIRTGIYLSPEGGALHRLVLPIRLFVGGPFGRGEQWYAWIHPKDEVNAIRFLIENEGARGVFNLTAPSPVRNKEFGKALARVLRRPFWLPVPGFAMHLLFGEVATVVLDGQRVYPRRLLDLGFTFRYPEIEMALESLRPHWDSN